MKNTEITQMNNWLYLSYILSPELSAYGNGKRVNTTALTSISNGGTSNNSFLEIPSHYGTHIDFPFHFSSDGKNGNEYDASFFIFNHIGIIDLTDKIFNDQLICTADLQNTTIDTDIEFLLIKTGFCNYRKEEKYWKNNPGFSPETANYLKTKYSKLRALGFDAISLSSYQNRELGRKAHKEFLIENNILIIEDMDLSQINNQTVISQLIIAPLMFQNADGSPVTVFAQIN